MRNGERFHILVEMNRPPSGFHMSYSEAMNRRQSRFIKQQQRRATYFNNREERRAVPEEMNRSSVTIRKQWIPRLSRSFESTESHCFRTERNGRKAVPEEWIVVCHDSEGMNPSFRRFIENYSEPSSTEKKKPSFINLWIAVRHDSKATK